MLERMRRKSGMKDELKKIVSDYNGSVSADNISYLIFNSAKKYIVYLDIESDLDWCITDEGEKEIDMDKLHSVLSLINSVIYRPCMLQLSLKMKRQVNCLLGSALLLSIQGLESEANECIKEAEGYLQKREYEITRKWYVEFSIGIFIAITIIYYLIGMMLPNDLKQKSFKLLWYGSMGAMLSIQRHNGFLNAKCTAGRLLVFLEILSKFVVAMLSAVIVVTAFKSGMFMSGFMSGQNESEFIMLICIVSGFSERLVPSLIQKIEGEDGETNEEKNINNLEPRR